MPVYAADEFRLPAPGVIVHLSPPLDPPMLKGIKVYPDNPFRFDFILDQGDSSVIPVQAGIQDQEQLKNEATRLIKYFLASLTIPEKDLWVNLSPYEKDRIIPQSFGLTEMGRDLLAEDYMLKQISASLIYPEGETGKKFWKRVYSQAAKKYGITNIPVNTFNKVWIVPEKAGVYENVKAGTAYVVESKLKVMLEQDYLALEKNSVVANPSSVIASPSTVIPAKAGNQDKNDINALGSQIVREIVIPELTKEINEDKNFARLRQVYNSLILATWYKKKIKDSILEQVYGDKKKVAGVGYEKFLSSPNALIGDPERIYQRYLKAFKKGVYNYIKEEIDPVTQEMIPRKYFSGGVKFFGDLAMVTTTDSAKLPQAMDRTEVVEARIWPADRAMAGQNRLLIPRANDFMIKNNIMSQIRKLMAIPGYVERQLEVGLVFSSQGIPIKERRPGEKQVSDLITEPYPEGTIGFHTHPNIEMYGVMANYQGFMPSRLDVESMPSGGEIIVWGSPEVGFYATMIKIPKEHVDEVIEVLRIKESFEISTESAASKLYEKGFIRFYRFVDFITGNIFGPQVNDKGKVPDLKEISLEDVLSLDKIGSQQALIANLKKDYQRKKLQEGPYQEVSLRHILRKIEGIRNSIQWPSFLGEEDKKFLRRDISQAAEDRAMVEQTIQEELKAIIRSTPLEESYSGYEMKTYSSEQSDNVLKNYIIKIHRGLFEKDNKRIMEGLDYLDSYWAFIKKYMGGIIAPFTLLNDVFVNGHQYARVVVQKKLIVNRSQSLEDLRSIYNAIKKDDWKPFNIVMQGLITKMIRRGIIYRDSMSPPNLGLDKDTGDIYLVDFGYATKALPLSKWEAVEYYDNKIPFGSIGLDKEGMASLWNEDKKEYPVPDIHIQFKVTLDSNHVQREGGIDLTPANMKLQTNNAGEGIKFHLNPAQLQQLQNAPGFVPVIINIQPMTDLRVFLGLSETNQSTDSIDLKS